MLFIFNWIGAGMALLAGLILIATDNFLLGCLALLLVDIPYRLKKRDRRDSLLAGLVAPHGLYTAFARARTLEKFAKLDAMKKQWGERAGTAVHMVGYTVVPIVVGVMLVLSALRRS